VSSFDHYANVTYLRTSRSPDPATTIESEMAAHPRHISNTGAGGRSAHETGSFPSLRSRNSMTRSKIAAAASWFPVPANRKPIAKQAPATTWA
jgi:hypothetical protein